MTGRSTRCILAMLGSPSNSKLPVPSSSRRQLGTSKAGSVVDTALEIKPWEGRVVFTDQVPSGSSSDVRPLVDEPVLDEASHLAERSVTHKTRGVTVPLVDPQALVSPQAPVSPQSPGSVPTQPPRSKHGTCASPISISSDSSPEPLVRPRGQVRYSTTIAKTAYTPPRTIPPRHTEPSQPIHPFFQRDFGRSRSTPPPPPPASQRPRLVAYYSSTSASSSAASRTTLSQSSQRTEWSERNECASRGTWLVGTRREIELVSHTLTPRRSVSSAASRSGSEEEEEQVERVGTESRRVNDIEAALRAMTLDLDSHAAFTGRQTHHHPPSSVRKPLATATHLPFKANQNVSTVKSDDSLKNTRFGTSTTPSHHEAPVPRSKVHVERELPVFSYKSLQPTPKVVYTSDLDEANMLLDCLKGNIIGFDLEWPIPGQRGPDGFKVGMAWDPEVGYARHPGSKRIKFIEPRTALMQFCDERMVVLVQIWGMPEIPSKAIEILQDPSIYKLGVHSRGDGSKLLRDFPEAFPNGIASLFELSKLARKADPVGTGPGARLIALARLVSAYLHKQLPKGAIRSSNWSLVLNKQQINYAANDVVCAIELFKVLKTMVEDQGLELNLDEFCSDVGNVPARPGTVHRRVPSPIPTPSEQPETTLAPDLSEAKPRELKAITFFKQGFTIRDMSDSLQIKEITVQGYIASGLSVLPPETLSHEEKRRFLDEVPVDGFVRRRYHTVFKQLRQDVGVEDVSDSERESEH